MYAIVDIETTGGHASANGITEIAIVIHNGKDIVDRYQTLVNPGMNIPVYIRALTGISDEMVSIAPSFKEIAPKIYELICDKIFIAHNVNFDYSFLRYHLASAGYNLQCKKLCTVRLGRRIFPGLSSYSLGKFSRHMGIEIANRHRAAGDAEATAALFHMMLEHDTVGHINIALSQKSKEQSLPPNLAKEQVERLPHKAGVYYFHNNKGKIIYVGKAKNIKKRVCTHFTNNNPGRQKQEFLRNIYAVTYQECGTELMAFILEAVEIKRLWPINNQALKRFEHAWGLYVFEDQRGYLRMAVDKRRKNAESLYTFNSIVDGYSILRTLLKQFNLCPKLCFIQKNNNECSGIENSHCYGACQGHEPYTAYNERVKQAMMHLIKAMPTYAIVDEGRNEQEKSCVLIETGQFYGMGYLKTDDDKIINDITALKTILTPYPANDYIKNMINLHASRFPERKVSFT